MRCVLYLRMSTEQQDKSIGDQRTALHEYAAQKGYTILAEYADEGISGDATEKRLQFQKMMADCSRKQFETILAWDQDRFGRFDPLEAGFWIKPMRDAGVMLETIAQGRVDWNNFASRLVWNVTQEAKHAFLRDLARNSIRGNISRAKSGRTAGPSPFGYKRNEDGRYVLDDDAKVAAVRRAFAMRAVGYGYGYIASTLREEQHPAPSVWSKDTVRKMVMNEVYTGVYVFAKRHWGKYHTTAGPATEKGIRHNPSPIRVEAAHPAIVTQQQWNTVQQLIDRPRKRGPSRNKGTGQMAGLLYCQCGAPMYSNVTSKSVATYICGTYHKGLGCGCKFVRQPWIHDVVAAAIKTRLGSSVDAIAAVIEQAMGAAPKKNAAILRRQIKLLDSKIEQAEKRILTVNQRLVAGLESQLLSLMDERETLRQQAETTDATPQRSAREVAVGIKELTDVLEGHDSPANVSVQLRAMFSKVVLDFDIGRTTKRGQSYTCVGGIIYGVSSKEWAVLRIYPRIWIMPQRFIA